MSAVKMQSVQTSDIRPITEAELHQVSGGATTRLDGEEILPFLGLFGIVVLLTHGTLNEGLHR